ncbi:hypothetical protein OTU49_006033 [Cherax quadricarinatus]|uniref:Uncharacterized protein n=1 Tax=Cherax quadricarinatus TaxID=27406 RepID=A0AAW0WQ58_CHEQU
MLTFLRVRPHKEWQRLDPPSTQGVAEARSSVHTRSGGGSILRPHKEWRRLDPPLTQGVAEAQSSIHTSAAQFWNSEVVGHLDFKNLLETHIYKVTPKAKYC